jgi:predicted glycogen debranching enzyme
MGTEVTPLRRLPWLTLSNRDPDVLLEREWLVTNGLGGYASGTVAGACTRRYHGLLVAALPAPLGRVVMLNHLAEEVRMPDGRMISLHGEELAGLPPVLHGECWLEEFRLEAGLPVWVYRFANFVLEKRIMQPHFQNTTLITYQLLEALGPVRLRLRPSFNFRPHEIAVSQPLASYRAIVDKDRVEFADASNNVLRMCLVADDGALVLDRGRVVALGYRLERQRGYDAEGSLYSPGYLRCNLAPHSSVTLAASTEEWDVVGSQQPAAAHTAELARRQHLIAAAVPEARDGLGAELVLAADQFIITPATRRLDAARIRASGEDVRTVIAGYHWFTDWGRDTMISLEGLTLCTGRAREAAFALRTFANYVRDGLLPNLFPEGENEGLYHTADATLWFFHALDRYVALTLDYDTLDVILPVLDDIIAKHVHGTRFGIAVDPADGLLRQGQEGYQLTWMDAKVDDWVVTPRRGKAVEINALWYNALRLLEKWTRERRPALGPRASELAKTAQRTRVSFNRRFWNRAGGYLYDVVDGESGDDASFRPNQVFAISLSHPVLDEAYWQPVMSAVMERLCTPMGLRSLAPGESEYKPRYDGDLRARDAAYHQGTVWAWLIGPMVDAWLRTFPKDSITPNRLLEGFEHHMREACVGSISEIFDAEAPYQPRGCIAQAWSVAEVLRCWVKTNGFSLPRP